MEYSLLTISVHLMCFAISFYALSSIQYDKFCNVTKPMKVQTLLVMLSMGLGYISAQFLLALTIFNGL